MNIKISETRCEVSLQSLLKHTVDRLCISLRLQFPEEQQTKLVLMLKYGFDGTNTNRYRQRSSEKSSVLDYIFCSSVVPLQSIDKATNRIYWKNPRPSSTRFCRPIKILFEKETNELCKIEEADLAQQIQNLEARFRARSESAPHFFPLSSRFCPFSGPFSSRLYAPAFGLGFGPAFKPALYTRFWAPFRGNFRGQFRGHFRARFRALLHIFGDIVEHVFGFYFTFSETFSETFSIFVLDNVAEIKHENMLENVSENVPENLK